MENKVVVILNYTTGSIDFLNYPQEIEDKVLEEHNGDVEVYLAEVHKYPTSNICYMVTNWESIENQLAFNDPNAINTSNKEIIINKRI